MMPRSSRLLVQHLNFAWQRQRLKHHGWRDEVRFDTLATFGYLTVMTHEPVLTKF